MYKKSRIALCLLTQALGFSVAQGQITVTPTNMHGWNIWNNSWAGGLPSSMVILGNATRPTVGGNGALWLLTGSGIPHSSEAGAWWSGYPGPAINTHTLSALQLLSYRTYVSNGSQLATAADKSFAPYIVLSIASSGPGTTDLYLTYEPRFNASVVAAAWQYWNSRGGYWWSTRYGQNVRYQLSQWISYFPKARINGIGVQAGSDVDYSYWNNKICAVDYVNIQFHGETNYLFDFAAL